MLCSSRCDEEAVAPAPLTQSRGAPSQGAPRTECVRDAYFGTRPISYGPVDARRTPAAPSSSIRSAAASPVPIVRLRVRGVTGVRVRRCTCAGATISLASIARRRILSSRATTDASTRSPSESGLPSSGTAIRFVDDDVSGVRSVACAVLLESLRRPLRHRDDLCIALTSRLGPQDIPGSEHQQGRQPHRSLAVPSIRRRTSRDRGARRGGRNDGGHPRLDPLGRVDVVQRRSDTRGKLCVTGRLDHLLESRPSPQRSHVDPLCPVGSVQG